jgi:hypothetical protein
MKFFPKSVFLYLKTLFLNCNSNRLYINYTSLKFYHYIHSNLRQINLEDNKLIAHQIAPINWFNYGDT